MSGLCSRHVPHLGPARGKVCASWSKLLSGIRYTQVGWGGQECGDLTKVKGLEFQHAFLVLGSAVHDELENGFKGSGTARYQRRRLLRIPFSRPKDSLVTFVTPSSPA
jgi:hypothetical protein